MPKASISPLRGWNPLARKTPWRASESISYWARIINFAASKRQSAPAAGKRRRTEAVAADAFALARLYSVFERSGYRFASRKREKQKIRASVLI
jgi:hypothetical protein